MKEILAGDAKDVLVGEAEAPETFVDSEDIAELFTVRSNDKLQLYCKKRRRFTVIRDCATNCGNSYRFTLC